MLAAQIMACSATTSEPIEQPAGAATIDPTSITVLASVTNVTVTGASTTLSVGSTLQLTATVIDSRALTGNDHPVHWSSSNSAVATVSGSGLVTGVASGPVTITATSSGKSGTMALTVFTMPVAAVTVSPASSSLGVGGTAQFSAAITDASGAVLTGRVVTWSSSNTGIATVSTTGLVTGVAAGSVTITAMCETKIGTAAITVSMVPVATVTVTPTTATIHPAGTRQFSAVPKDANGTSLTGRAVT